MAVIVAAAAVWGGLRLWRSRAAADVTEFTPADVEALLWIPRVDDFTERLVEFTRGVQEAASLREILKPETGVDLGDPDGLRRAGVDPEAGLVVYSRHGMLHMLFGVEDPDRFIEALRAKFVNLGHEAPQAMTKDGNPPIWRVPGPSGAHAAFATDDGLLALVYRGGGGDPVDAVATVLEGQSGSGFFTTPRFKEIEARLGLDGPLIYADGGSLARTPDGKSKLGWLDRLELPGVVDTFVRQRAGAWLSRVSYAAARISVEPCSATIRSSMEVADGATLLPPAWLAPDPPAGPDFGRLLPRDTVLFTRIALNVKAATEVLEQLSKLGSGMSEIGEAIGLGGRGFDPVAGLLGDLVHPQLDDRHLVKDVLDHVTGHIAVAVVGLDKRADIGDIGRLTQDPLKWLNTVSVVLAIHLREPRAFLDKWWPKVDVLGGAGFSVKRLVHPDWTILRLQRGCGEKDKSCEHYGALVAGGVLFLMSGEATLDRVLATVNKEAKDLHGLTKEPLAQAVLEHGKLFAGAYFSFDGLLKAIRNRNLPGGATRYLAQAYELALTLDVAGGGAGGTLLLTR